MQDLTPTGSPAGIYVHVPFCQAICGYCNFNRGVFDADLKARYVDALVQEIAGFDAAGAFGTPSPAADTIFFGGGTPSLLEPDEIARIVAVCRGRFALARDAEITLETNPETATEARLVAFRDAGINRISFGVQSFDDAELRRLGRIHSAARARDAIAAARRAGFDNLSFDLMLWLPGQSRASWRATVDQAIALAPDHLSLYLLELYPNAPLKESMARAAAADLAWAQAADDEAADMYLEGLDALDRAGYEQYEISNVSRPGFRSRHNVKYWQQGDWAGFGCGAHATVRGVRWRNVAATEDYIARVNRAEPVSIDRHQIPADERIGEALFTGLRLSEGIDIGNFRARHGVDPWSRHADRLAPLVEADLVWRRDGRFGLTRAGMLVANEILVAFV